MWVKTTKNTYGLTKPLTVVLSNQEFPNDMDVNTKIDLFAVLSWEQTQKMAQCTELRKDLNEDSTISGEKRFLQRKRMRILKLQKKIN